MRKLPPFLPGLSTKIQGRQKRRQLQIPRAKRDEALASSISDLVGLFHDIIPTDWLAVTAADLRKRLFPRVAVFWAWLSQVLEQNESCAKALALIEAWHKANSLTPPVLRHLQLLKGPAAPAIRLPRPDSPACGDLRRGARRRPPALARAPAQGH